MGYLEHQRIDRTAFMSSTPLTISGLWASRHAVCRGLSDASGYATETRRHLGLRRLSYGCSIIRRLLYGLHLLARLET